MFKSFKNNQAFTRTNPPAGGLDGFTLVELIIVIALIAILALIIFIIIDPTKMKAKVNDGKVRDDVSQIAGAIAQYMADYNITNIGCNYLKTTGISPTYFKDDVYPVHPCRDPSAGSGYRVKVSYTSNIFSITGQLCSSTSWYNSQGSIVNAYCGL